MNGINFHLSSVWSVRGSMHESSIACFWKRGSGAILVAPQPCLHCPARMQMHIFPCWCQWSFLLCQHIWMIHVSLYSRVSLSSLADAFYSLCHIHSNCECRGDLISTAFTYILIHIEAKEQSYATTLKNAKWSPPFLFIELASTMSSLETAFNHLYRNRCIHGPTLGSHFWGCKRIK